MDYICQKIVKNDLVLESWKKYLEQIEKDILDSELADYEWYAVIQDNQAVAIFQIIDVLKVRSKNLQISFHPNFEKDDTAKIILFIYKSMLSICGDKDIWELKLYIDNRLIQDIFKIIVNYELELGKNIKSTKNYGKWIEIVFINKKNQ